MVELRGTNANALRRVVDRGVDELRARVDFPLPRHVRRELDGFLGCCDPDRGFAWLTCTGCDVHRLVPFTCKGRGFCPTCGGRRMDERAARWCEELVPHVPVRQWVLTVPWRLRWRLARDPKALRAVIDIAIGEIRSFYERRGTSTGAITVVQRFGSKLNLNVHLHVLFLDGAFEAGPRGRPVFRHGPRVTDDDVGALVAAIAERVLVALPPSEEAVDEDEPLALFQAASIQGRSALGELPRPQRLGARALPPLCAAVDGFNLHAGVTVRARDRQALERLCRYVGRPPLALGRVQELPDGRVSIALRRPWSDGSTSFVLTAAQLVERLVAGVPGAEPRPRTRTRSCTTGCSPRGTGGGGSSRPARAGSRRRTSRRSS